MSDATDELFAALTAGVNQSKSDFDRYCDEHGIGPEDAPQAFADWLAESGWSGSMRKVSEEMSATDELVDVIAEVNRKHWPRYQYIGPIHYICWCGGYFLDRPGWETHHAEEIVVALAEQYGTPEIGTDLDYDDTGDERAGFKLNADGEPLLRRRLVFPWQAVKDGGEG